VASGASSTLLARTAQAQLTPPRRFVIREDRFGRLFPNLDPFFRENSPRLRAALQDIGKVGGILDARDELGDGGKAAAIALIVDPNLSLNNPNNSGQTAGSTFIGQFLDHDVTFDLTSRLAVVAEPTESPNERTPAFDADSVYGGARSGIPSSTSPCPGEAGRVRRNSGSRAGDCSKICPATETAARSSQTRATTRT
jgi:hypothetical protein